MLLLIHTLYINTTWQQWQVFAPPYLIRTTGLSLTGHQHARSKIVPSGMLHFITLQASQKAKTLACQIRCGEFYSYEVLNGSTLNSVTTVVVAVPRTVGSRVLLSRYFQIVQPHLRFA